jgi:DNA-binding transcriptional regulator of glucitol operon
VDYQRILRVVSDRGRLGQGPLTCREMAAAFGIETVPAKVETLRSKAKRLVARGWLAESAPGQFTLMPGAAGPGGGS